MMAAVAFLTCVGRSRQPDDRSLDWFPVVGALIGAAVGLVWWGAAQVWSPLVAAVVAVAADLALTGGLHLDGVGDTADGLLPHLDRERRLAAMADPHQGSFGVAAVVMALLARVAALGSLAPDVGLVAALWCASRTLMAVVARSMPYARPQGGLATAFLGRSPAVPAAAGALVAGALATVAVVGLAPALAALAALAAAGGVVAVVARRRLGGFTGDVLGAAGVAGETVGLLVAAARW